MIALLILTAAVVVLQLLPQELVIQSRHDCRLGGAGKQKNKNTIKKGECEKFYNAETRIWTSLYYENKSKDKILISVKWNKEVNVLSSINLYNSSPYMTCTESGLGLLFIYKWRRCREVTLQVYLHPSIKIGILFFFLTVILHLSKIKICLESTVFYNNSFAKWLPFKLPHRATSSNRCIPTLCSKEKISALLPRCRNQQSHKEGLQTEAILNKMVS